MQTSITIFFLGSTFTSSLPPSCLFDTLDFSEGRSLHPSQPYPLEACIFLTSMSSTLSFQNGHYCITQQKLWTMTNAEKQLPQVEIPTQSKPYLATALSFTLIVSPTDHGVLPPMCVPTITPHQSPYICHTPIDVLQLMFKIPSSTNLDENRCSLCKVHASQKSSNLIAPNVQPPYSINHS